MSILDDPLYELDQQERDSLGYYAEHRYRHYRRRLKLATRDAYVAALAWQANNAAQRSRRLGHDTGAENWR